jgi:hypothetical protein
VAMAAGGGLSALAALYGVLAWWRLRTPGSQQTGPTALTRRYWHRPATG